MRPGPKGSAGTTCTEDLQPGIRQPRKPAARKQDLRCSDTVSVRIPAHKTIPKRPHSAPRERGCRGERIQFRACHTLHRAGLRGAFLTEVPAHRCFPESVAASPRSTPPNRQPISSIPRQHSAPARHKKGPQTSVRGPRFGITPPAGSYSLSSFLAAASMALFRAARPAMSPSVVFSTEALIFFTVDFVASAAARFSAFSAATASRRASS